MPLSSRTIRHIAVSLIIIFSTATTLLAQDSGTGWSYDSTTNTLTLSGDNVDWSAIKDFSSTTENVVFADDYAISSIPSQAFYEFSKLTAIDIPNVVTSIGGSAFRGCTSLASVNLPDDLTSLGDYAFFGCTSLTSVNLPDDLTSLGDYAFFGCTSLTSVNVPDKLTSTGQKTFYYCTSLASISFPDGLTSIGTSAFAYCTSLTSITLPDGLTSLGDFAFHDCTSLTSITIPDGIQSIGGCTFDNCTSLTSITIPATITSINARAFFRCSSLTSVEILSNGTPDNKHIIYLGGKKMSNGFYLSNSTDKTSNGYDIFPIHQATLIYDPNTTWIGDDDYQNLRYYFNSFASPTSIHSNTISNSAPHYFDLSGHPISPTTHKGIAVKLQDGHSSLITVK